MNRIIREEKLDITKEKAIPIKVNIRNSMESHKVIKDPLLKTKNNKRT